MNERTGRRWGLLTAVVLAGCATTETRGSGGTTGADALFGCERISFSGPMPPPKPPTEWRPSKAERGFVHLYFFVAKGQVFVIGAPVVDLRPGDPFFVGPMTNLDAAFPAQQSQEYLRKYPDWGAFYHQLFKAYGDSRPLALVCPGPDCPKTPEGPPPSLFGVTASYSNTVPPGALGPTGDLPRFAALDAQDASRTATDASTFAAQGRSEEAERQLRALFSDVVTRAVCAARVLTPSAK